MSIIISVNLFIIGAVLGSFYRVLATRLPNGKSIIYPSSHCEYCNHPLSWIELIPIISYILQKGKCKKCHHPLEIGYLLSELGTGLLFVISYLKFGLSADFLISILLSSLLVIIFISDMKYMIILDSPLIMTLLISFIIKWLNSGIESALLATASGFFTFLLMLLISKFGSILFKKEALGGGDIKLSFVMGFILGFPMAMIALVLATFLALPYATACLLLKKDHVVPFGPFLISALWLVFLFYEKFSNILNFLFLI